MPGSCQGGSAGRGVMSQKPLAKVEMWESEELALARTSAADQGDTLGPYYSSGMYLVHVPTTSQLHEAIQT